MRLQIVDVLSVNPQKTSGWHSPALHTLQDLATCNGKRISQLQTQWLSTYHPVVLVTDPFPQSIYFA